MWWILAGLVGCADGTGGDDISTVELPAEFPELGLDFSGYPWRVESGTYPPGYEWEASYLCLELEPGGWTSWWHIQSDQAEPFDEGDLGAWTRDEEGKYTVAGYSWYVTPPDRVGRDDPQQVEWSVTTIDGDFVLGPCLELWPG